MRLQGSGVVSWYDSFFVLGFCSVVLFARLMLKIDHVHMLWKMHHVLSVDLISWEPFLFSARKTKQATLDSYSARSSWIIWLGILLANGRVELPVKCLHESNMYNLCFVIIFHLWENSSLPTLLTPIPPHRYGMFKVVYSKGSTFYEHLKIKVLLVM